jgi:hypothetical protein
VTYLAVHFHTIMGEIFQILILPKGSMSYTVSSGLLKDFFVK